MYFYKIFLDLKALFPLDYSVASKHMTIVEWVWTESTENGEYQCPVPKFICIKMLFNMQIFRQNWATCSLWGLLKMHKGFLKLTFR